MTKQWLAEFEHEKQEDRTPASIRHISIYSSDKLMQSLKTPF